MKTAAVITAAGLSSRMGDFKPLLKLGEYSFAERMVRTFLSVGVEEIVLVTGFRADELEAHLSQYGIKFVRNENYADTQMFDSVRLGFEALSGDVEAAFFTPVDVPLFLAQTLRKELLCDASVVVPVHEGHSGHPVLFRREVIPLILSHNGERGLRGVMDKCAAVCRLEVQDKGTIHDADTKDEYRYLKLLEKGLSQTSPVLLPDECETLLERYETPQNVREHCRAVADTAIRISTELRKNGIILNDELLCASALVHDICRTQPDHAKAGAKLLNSLGFTEIADIIAQHHDFLGDLIDEAAVLFIADKQIQGTRSVSIDERFAKSSDKCIGPEAISAHRERWSQANKIKEKINRICGKSVIK